MNLSNASVIGMVCLLAAGCSVTTTTSPQPAHSTVAERGTLIRTGDQLYVLMAGITGPEAILRTERTVDKDGVVVLPWIGKVHLAGVAIKDASAAIHRTCRHDNIDFEGDFWVWRMEGSAVGNDPDAPLAAGDQLKILMSGINHPGDDEFLTDIRDDGSLRITGMKDIPAAHHSERQLEVAIVSALHAMGLQNAMAIVSKLPRDEH